jgi:DNA-binding transcriptional LysR family regulator
VAATPQTIDGIFSTFLHRFAERRPNVQIKLTEAVGADLESVLERGQVHITVSLVQPNQANSPFIESVELSPLEFFAAFAVPLEIGTGRDVDITRLAAYPLLLLDTSFYVRQTFDAACRLAGVKPDIFMESRTPHALLALAEAGHGVAIVPSVLPIHRYKLRIMRLTHGRKPLRERFAILWDKRRVLPPYAEDFRQSLAAYMRESFPISRPSAPKAGNGRARARSADR